MKSQMKQSADFLNSINMMELKSLKSRHIKEVETIILDESWVPPPTKRKVVQKKKVTQIPTKAVKPIEDPRKAKKVANSFEAVRRAEKSIPVNKMPPHQALKSLKEIYPKESGIKHRLIKIDIPTPKKNVQRRQNTVSSENSVKKRKSDLVSRKMDIPDKKSKEANASKYDEIDDIKALKSRGPSIKAVGNAIESVKWIKSLDSVNKRKSDLVSCSSKRSRKKSSEEKWVSYLRSIGNPRELITSLPVGCDIRLLAVRENELELRLKVYAAVARLLTSSDKKLDYIVNGSAIKDIDIIGCDYDTVRCINGFLSA